MIESTTLTQLPEKLRANHNANVLAYEIDKAILDETRVDADGYCRAYEAWAKSREACVVSLKALMQARPDYHKVRDLFESHGITVKRRLYETATQAVAA